MFTGIVEGVGTVKKVDSLGTHTRLWIASPFSLQGTKLGDSVAVNGCCLTVTTLKGRVFSADVSPETLTRTNLGELTASSPVNLERPLRVGDRLGGHLVQGHVDGVGTIALKRYFDAQPNPYYLIQIRIPKSLASYMIEKGSVTIDGISLTVNEVRRDTISLCIIPHTQERTTLTAKEAGAKVNLEADLVLKFLEKTFQTRLDALFEAWQRRDLGKKKGPTSRIAKKP